MKKWLISFLLLTSVFIGYNKVNAEETARTVTFDYDGTYADYWVDADTLRITNTMINYMNSNYPGARYIIYTFSKAVDNNNQENLVTLDFLLPESERGRYFLTTYSRGSDYGYTLRVNYADSYEGVFQNGYLTQKGNLNLYRSSGGSPIQCLKTDSNEQCINKLSNITTETYKTYGSTVYQDLGTYINRHNSTNLFSMCASSTIPNNCPSNFYVHSLRMILYSSFDIPITALENSNYFTTLKFKYGDNVITSNKGDKFYTYYDMTNTNYAVPNSVKDFGNNTFGFYQNIVDVSGATLDGPADSVGVICEENKPFENGYCSLNYEDLKNKNSDISVFNNYGMMFIQMFGNNTGYLYNDKYYLYSFRVQKPFVPSVGNLFINSFNNNTIKTNILNVWALDGGSYTDYVVKFKIENSDYNATTNLKNIMVVFKNGLGSYYNNLIPSSFNFSVYRSFKLQYFDNEPTNLDVNNFHNTNDLSTIDGISSQTSFFTDNEFNSFGFGGIITAPFRFLYALENYESCSDINVPFPHSNQNLTLTCVRKNIPSSLNPLIVILQVVLSGIISYRIAVGTLRIIKDVSSPDNANIEVVDL